jgi:hypothetical protein
MVRSTSAPREHGAALVYHSSIIQVPSLYTGCGDRAARCRPEKTQRGALRTPDYAGSNAWAA